MKCPVYLQTKPGIYIYQTVLDQYVEALKDGSISEYKTILISRRDWVSSRLNTLLNDPFMEERYSMEKSDVIGWTKYKEMSDEYAVLDYFAKRQP